MKKALITGINGFVGTHLSSYLLQSSWDILGIDRSQIPDNRRVDAYSRIRKIDEPITLPPVIINDMTAPESLHEILETYKPDFIFHLAGLAFVPDSWKSPSLALQSNTIITANLVESMISSSFSGRLLYISSADVYGSASSQTKSLSETDPVSPENPYSVSKIASEQLVRLYSNHGIDVVIARPFNHTGPLQNDNFVVPAFLRRIKNAMSNNEMSITVGDLESTRDFTDVRDICSAYEILALRGTSSESYNVCSGNPVSIGRILDIARDVSNSSIPFTVDKSLLRPEGPTHRFGNNTKLRSTGWSPEYELRQTIQDIWDTME